MIRFLTRSFLIGLALIWFNTIMISPSLAAADQVTNLTSSSHQISERSNNNEITVTWDASGITDLDGFAYEWTNDSATIPADRNLGSDASTVTSDSLADGTWYFHIRPVLTASPFYGTTSHLGPFIIVTVPVGDDWSPNSPKPGDSVTLSGFNLKEGLQISFYADSGMTNLKATASNIFIISGDETHATFTVPQNLAPGTYYLKLKNTDGKTGQVAGFEVTSAKVLDVDGDGRQDALTDGLLIIRYLFGFRGADLIRDAVGVGATRTSATEIEDYIKNSLASLDIDNNQTEDALTDGLLIIRYLFGFRGTDLIRDAVGVGATRTSATEIEDYIESLK